MLTGPTFITQPQDRGGQPLDAINYRKERSREEWKKGTEGGGESGWVRLKGRDRRKEEKSGRRSIDIHT